LCLDSSDDLSRRPDELENRVAASPAPEALAPLGGHSSVFIVRP